MRILNYVLCDRMTEVHFCFRHWFQWLFIWRTEDGNARQCFMLIWILWPHLSQPQCVCVWVWERYARPGCRLSIVNSNKEKNRRRVHTRTHAHTCIHTPYIRMTYLSRVEQIICTLRATWNNSHVKLNFRPKYHVVDLETTVIGSFWCQWLIDFFLLIFKCLHGFQFAWFAFMQSRHASSF